MTRQSPTRQQYDALLAHEIQSDANRQQILDLSWITHGIDESYSNLIDGLVDGTIWCSLDDDLPVQPSDVSQAKRLIDEMIMQLMTLDRELDKLSTVS